ncbi:hypothetical protein [Arthrobacter methylotrophus]|uniref:hypothetical protein n=1 Tax=Arthrobacter methylotrophus TaxID=121291 RepID=UPI0031E709E5
MGLPFFLVPLTMLALAESRVDVRWELAECHQWNESPLRTSSASPSTLEEDRSLPVSLAAYLPLWTLRKVHHRIKWNCHSDLRLNNHAWGR